MATPSTDLAKAPGSPVATVTKLTQPPALAVHQAAQKFTSFFLSQSLESMFAGVDTNSLFGGGPSEAIFRSMLVQQYGQIAAQQGGGLGITDAVQRQMLQAQEASTSGEGATAAAAPNTGNLAAADLTATSLGVTGMSATGQNADDLGANEAGATGGTTLKGASRGR